MTSLTSPGTAKTLARIFATTGSCKDDYLYWFVTANKILPLMIIWCAVHAGCVLCREDPANHMNGKELKALLRLVDIHTPYVSVCSLILLSCFPVKILPCVT